MARHFKEQDIDEFRECFYLHARSGQITKLNELRLIMRSLGVSPTEHELKKYFKDKGEKLSFADFLEIMHQHSMVEKLPKEILDAFRAYDTTRQGTISAKDLRHVLGGWGEKVSPQEIDRLFKEAKIPANGNVRYEDFVRLVCQPVPDYY